MTTNGYFMSNSVFCQLFHSEHSTFKAHHKEMNEDRRT